ncbi:DUF647-domain-containing protein [Hortaea werneckii]|nr:DUF647-domain-containing protein [Hortaea werneckii]
MSGKRLEFTEHDEAGNVTATYISSPENSEGLSRVDVILPEKTKSVGQRLLDVFLPVGYPHSVTDDYLEYQIYDSLQAFSSSIAGLLSSRAVLSSVGVGDSSASPTAALLLSILQESAGRIATILFAHRFGTSLEPECKMYRLLADVLNDFAFILDCLSPAFPKPVRIVVLSSSSVLRALCGVAAGSAKASLSAHFARWGNLGELNAKDSSQETVISLMGMLAGSLVVSWVTSQTATWAALILLLSIHLETNRRAVRSVSMRTLNRQRATLVYHQLRQGRVPKPEDVSSRERIFEKDGILRGAHGETIGWCSFQSSVKSLFECQKLQEHRRNRAGLLATGTSGFCVIRRYGRSKKTTLRSLVLANLSHDSSNVGHRYSASMPMVAQAIEPSKPHGHKKPTSAALCPVLCRFHLLTSARRSVAGRVAQATSAPPPNNRPAADGAYVPGTRLQRLDRARLTLKQIRNQACSSVESELTGRLRKMM